MTETSELSPAGQRLVTAVAALLSAGREAGATLCTAGFHPNYNGRLSAPETTCRACGKPLPVGNGEPS